MALPRQERTSAEILSVILIILGAILLLAYGIGLIFLVPGILIWYYSREKCPYCNARGRIRPVKSEIIRQERGYGIVTRTDIVRGRVGNQRQRSSVSRQERVPVVTTTTRVSYQCSNCQRIRGTRDFTAQAEDFSPPQQTIQREVVQKRFSRFRADIVEPS
jgi:DNA-directed RNA polymerase subunit RPC12/RpoP